MRLEELVIEVADVDGEGAIVCELVGAGAADAEGGVCAADDDDFPFDSSGKGFRSFSWGHDGLGERDGDVHTDLRSRELFGGFRVWVWRC